MKKQRIKRITLAGSGNFEEINFTNVADKFLVKNFTEGDIFVSMDEDATENDALKIPKSCYQVVVGNECDDLKDFRTDTLYIKGSGEIEVQELCFQ